MTCSVCHKPANDNAVAYYKVPAPGFVQHNGSETATGFSALKPRHIVKCWTCLTPAEKVECGLGYSDQDQVRFEMIRSLRTK